MNDITLLDDRVRIELDSHLAHVRLSRPDKRNGLDLPMFDALIEAGERLAQDRTVRAVVLSGEGKAFCAGLDWQAFLSIAPEERRRLLEHGGPAESQANRAQQACFAWAELPVPVIAAVQGAAFGGGLQLALACDLRYAARDAQLSAMEVRYGLVPDMTLSLTLPRLVRADVARELVFTGRVVAADEAAALGLVTRVCDDPLAEAMATARAIAGRSPEAVRAAKRLLNAAPGLPVREALLLETELQRGLLGTPNQMEAVAAVMTRRDPSFSDPT
jgi:enoyl-CoA hydratase/carnithine racemase